MNAILNLILAVQAKDSYFDIILKAGWILIPIALLSIATLYIIIERSEIIRKARKKDPKLTDEVIQLIKEKKIEEAIQRCTISNSPLGNIFIAGLQRSGKPIAEIQEAVENESRQQIASLELNLNYLGVISSIAPMFGFLGTIFGVIKIFYNISLTDNISIGNIAGGLYQKMISSAFGLAVGVASFSGYHWLNSRVERIIIGMERDCNRFIDALR